MRRYNSLGDLPLGGPRRVVAIGTFDGVHIGHQAVIGRALELAAQRGLGSMALTFEPQPIAVLRPELKPAVLTHIAFKSQLIERLGVDELLVVPFTRAFSRIRAERFAEMLVAPPVGADAVVVGENFRFGHQGSGTVEMLAQFGRSRALRVESPPMITSPDGKPVSSTRIRRLVATGQVAAVIPLLGRMHSVEGVVVHGDARGRSLGVPTANLEIPADSAIPSRGVYACRAVLASGRSAAAVNIGVAPTFTGADARSTLRIEAFLLDHDGSDIYGQTMRIDFIERLRDEKRFASADELVAQIHEDVARTRELAARPPGDPSA
ncbi:MAG: bifunctional riboflavin kinase/FAD synthetase [Thermoleophilia bacterium]